MPAIATKKHMTIKKAPYGITNKLDEWKFGRTNGLIQKTVLKRDILRGVRFLNESAYSEIWGRSHPVRVRGLK